MKAGSPFAAEQQFYTPPLLINPLRFPVGAFEFYFNNQTPLNFEILYSTNAASPLASWGSLGTATDLGNGYYRFTDAAAIGQPQRFYRLRAQ